ncbi:DnaA N-terminal domain-containing protein, partial [Aetokthonos hydrillicola]
MEITIESLWSQVLERLQLELSRPTFETWIKTASAERLENNSLVIRTPNPFARNWLQKYYIKTLGNVVKDILGYPVEIYITVAKGDEVSPEGEREISWGLPPQN